MIRRTYNIEGVIKEIGRSIKLNKNEFNEESYKKIITIQTSDKQLLFVDVVKQKLNLLDKNDIKEGSNVKVELAFSGVEKNGTKFNNLYCHNIRVNNKK